MNEDLEMQFHEAIVRLLEKKPGSCPRSLRTRLVKDGIRKWFPEFNEYLLQSALRTLEHDGFIFEDSIGRWFTD